MGEEEAVPYKMSIINHTSNKYAMLVHGHLDLSPLNLVYLYNNISSAVGSLIWCVFDTWCRDQTKDKLYVRWYYSLCYSYVHRMADSLSKVLGDSEKMMSLSRLMVIRSEEALEEEKQIQPQIDLLRKRTHELQEQVQIFVCVCVLTLLLSDFIVQMKHFHYEYAFSICTVYTRV